MSFELKNEEALHIGWEKPSLNKQVNHVNLTLILHQRVYTYKSSGLSGMWLYPVYCNPRQ